MTERSRFYSHLPERNPSPSDYDKVERIEVVHLKVDADGGNTREQLVRERLRRLRANGIRVEEVGVETRVRSDQGRTVVGGSLGDVCVPKRRRVLRDNNIEATIDTALTSDY
jgi:hypothetical protein